MTEAAEYAPLTFQQQWLWGLLQQHDDWNCTLASGFRLRGRLDTSALQSSITEVIRRHDALRTSIFAAGMELKQQIDPPAEYRLEVIGASGTDSRATQADATRLFERFADEQLDPTAGPLHRAQLIVISDREHWLLLAFHRLIVDCFSTEQVFREMWSAYRLLLQGQSAELAKESRQYSDYAHSQQALSCAWQQKHAPYWEAHLAGVNPVSWRPHRRGATGRNILGKMNSRFDKALTAALRDLGRRNGSLTATVMLTVYVIVLWRWCGQADFVMPFNIAGRQAEDRAVVGYFSHVLFLRVHLTGNETFIDLLRRVSNEFYRALSHQDLGRLAAQRPELLAGTFCQWITWHPDDIPAPQRDTPGQLEELEVERLTVRDFGEGLTAIPPGMVDIEISFFDTGEEIYVGGVYRSDMFAPNVMEQLVADLQSVSGECVRNPHAPLSHGGGTYEACSVFS